MSSAPTPVVTWIVDVTCAVDGQQVVHRLALQTQGPAALDRDVTERAEAVHAGVAHLVGTHADRIEGELSALLDDAVLYERMSRAVNPYGDGRAAVRAASAIECFLGLGERVPDFTP